MVPHYRIERWKKFASIGVLSLVACLAITQVSTATTIALWTFETSVPTTAGPHAAEGGTQAGSSVASGFHSSGSVVYSNPAGNGSAESFSSNFWSTDDYYQFTTNTTGESNIVFGWDQTRSGTGPDMFRVDVDYGSGFVTVLNSYTVDPVTWSSGTHQPDSVFGPISLGALADNNSALTVRLTQISATGATGGTNRVDNVFFEAIPEPTSAMFALMGLLGSWTLIRRRT